MTITDNNATKLEAQGIRLCETDIRGVTIGIKNKSVIIFGGKNGTLSVDMDMVAPLFKELFDIVDHLK